MKSTVTGTWNMRLTTILLCLFILSTAHPCAAQSGWFWQNPYPQGNDLEDLCILDENTAIAVGKHGTILRTIDRGATWELLNSGALLDLYAVTCTDANVVFAAGQGGTILTSTNQGADWSSVLNFSTETILRIAFADAHLGIAVGERGLILRSMDGGRNWSLIPAITNHTLRAISIVNSDTAFAAGDGGTMLRSVDGGRSWSPLASGTTTRLTTICFPDGKTGLAAGYNLILRSTNWGLIWHQLPLETGMAPYKMSFSSDGTLILVGSSGSWRYLILNSTDRGENWQEAVLQGAIRERRQARLSGLHIFNEYFGLAVGDRGSIFRSTDGGYHWDMIGGVDARAVRDVCMIDSRTGIAVGADGMILRTTDGGAKWIEVDHGTTYHFTSVSFADALLGAVVSLEGITLRTTDGGITWHMVDDLGVNLSSIAFADRKYAARISNHVVGVENRGHVHLTSDGGVTWRPAVRLETYYIHDVAFPDSTFCIAVGTRASWVWGMYGFMYASTDQGKTWGQLQAGDSSIFTGVCFLDKRSGYVVGERGCVLRTTDAGRTWEKRSIATDQYISAASFVTVDVGTVVGQQGGIFRTTDGGLSWEQQEAGTKQYLQSVSFTDELTGTIVGADGAILRTTTGGLTWTADAPSLPKDIRLGANYPNPFSSSTSIGFSLDGPNYVSIIVTDMFGRQISRLYDTVYRDAGEHRVHFQAGDLPAGVYFYTLITGERIESRKMLLLR